MNEPLSNFMGLEFQQYACELCVGSSQGKSRQVKALGQEDWRTNSDFGHISGHIFVWCEMFEIMVRAKHPSYMR